MAVKMSSRSRDGVRLRIDQLRLDFCPEARPDRPSRDEVYLMTEQLLQFIGQRDEVPADRGRDIDENVNIAPRRLLAPRPGAEQRDPSDRIAAAQIRLALP